MTDTPIIEPHYAFDNFGELRFHNDGEPRHHGPEALAIAYTADDGVLYKHGPETGVRAHYEKLRVIDPHAQLVVLPMDALRGPKGEAILAEINACIAISGRVAKLEERLTALTDEEAASEEDYNKMIARCDEIFFCEEGTPEAAEFKELTDRIEKYEATHFPPIDPPTPLEALKFREDQERPIRDA